MDAAAARAAMIELQLRPRGISDEAVLGAIQTVPRHLFIPENNRDLAYRDGPVAIGEGQTISQPYIVALMSAALQTSPGMRVLEIGTGSGYQAAILSALGTEVHSIEVRPTLHARAQRTLESVGAADVHTHLGDGFEGLPEHAPFDRIIVTAAPTRIPAQLVAQLKPDGRMLIPVGERQRQTLMVVTRPDGVTPHTEAMIPVLFVPMTEG
jgi:protein-L-isoaspartate(D-aspartate) O-methyltransferase